MGKADHRAAYEDLLRRYVAPLRRLAWSYEPDPTGREDLFQEIAMALWTGLPAFRGDSSERTWVYRVAHNTAITFAARRRTVPYWYLLPLFVPVVSVAVSSWQKSRWLALVPLVVTVAAYGFIGWLSVSVGVRALRAARAKVESMFPEES